MATDATGTPTTVLGLPKLNVSVDPPSGKGINAMMDDIDTKVVGKPSGIASGEVPVWDGSAWVRSSVTRVGVTSLGSGSPSGSNFLRGDGTWASAGVSVVAPAVHPTFVATSSDSGLFTPVANTAYLMNVPSIGGDSAGFAVTKIGLAIGTSSGNLDVGVYYTDDESTFTRLFSTGSFASPGTGKQTKSFASQTITPVSGRRWFVALAPDNATVTFRSGPWPIGSAYSKATSFPLPASLTTMTAITASAPIMFIQV